VDVRQAVLAIIEPVEIDQNAIKGTDQGHGGNGDCTMGKLLSHQSDIGVICFVHGGGCLVNHA
jgi:hypothetical protein